MVPNLQRSLIVVPVAGVFNDANGDIAMLEQEVAQDPSKRIELLKLLHVSHSGR